MKCDLSHFHISYVMWLLTLNLWINFLLTWPIINDFNETLRHTSIVGNSLPVDIARVNFNSRTNLTAWNVRNVFILIEYISFCLFVNNAILDVMFEIWVKVPHFKNKRLIHEFFVISVSIVRFRQGKVTSNGTSVFPTGPEHNDQQALIVWPYVHTPTVLVTLKRQ